MLILVIGIVFLLVVLHPLIFYFSAWVVRVKDLRFWRTCAAWLLLFLINLAMGAASLMLLNDRIEICLLVGILGIVFLVLLVKEWLHTSGWRATGCYLLYSGIAVGLAFGVRAVAIEAFSVPTDAMSPTVMAGDRILVDKITRYIRQPAKGNIVAFHPPDNPKIVVIKRVIGSGGDRIEVRDSVVYVNGAPSGQCPLYPNPPPGMTPLEFPCTVPPGKLFLLGDYREQSLDSRHFGFVDTNAVVGVAVIIYGSVEQPLQPYEAAKLRKEGKESHPGRIRWERIGTVLK